MGRDPKLIGTPSSQRHRVSGDTKMGRTPRWEGQRDGEDVKVGMTPRWEGHQGGEGSRLAGALSSRVTKPPEMVVGLQGDRRVALAAGAVPCAGAGPLSQAVSPDPLNHWKIRQGGLSPPHSDPGAGTGHSSTSERGPAGSALARRSPSGSACPPSPPPASPPALLLAPCPRALSLHVCSEIVHEAGVAPEHAAALHLLLEHLAGRRPPGRGGGGGDDAAGLHGAPQVDQQPAHLHAGAAEAVQDGGLGRMEVALVPGDVLQLPVHAGHGAVQSSQIPLPWPHFPPQPLQQAVGPAQVVGQVLLLLLLAGKALGLPGGSGVTGGNGVTGGTAALPHRPRPPEVALT